MKQVALSVGLLSLGLAVGLVMPRVLAQAPQGEVPKWEQFCEWTGGRATEKKLVEAVNAGLAANGKEGYQLVNAFGYHTKPILCYRRPAR